MSLKNHPIERIKEAVDRNDHNGLKLQNEFNTASVISTDTEHKLVLRMRCAHNIIKMTCA
jgi:hypothetical protein